MYLSHGATVNNAKSDATSERFFWDVTKLYVPQARELNFYVLNLYCAAAQLVFCNKIGTQLRFAISAV